MVFVPVTSFIGLRSHGRSEYFWPKRTTPPRMVERASYTGHRVKAALRATLTCDDHVSPYPLTSSFILESSRLMRWTCKSTPLQADAGGKKSMTVNNTRP